MRFIVGCLLLFVLFGGLLVQFAWIRRRWRVHPEVCRKVIHIAMGMACLTFPSFVSTIWEIICLGVLFAAILAILRFSSSAVIARFDIFRVTRSKSVGEFYFVAGVALAFIFSEGNLFAYFTSVLLLTFADAAAGSVGIYIGKIRCWSNSKTLEGSVAFLIVSLFCVVFATVITKENPDFLIGGLVCLIATITEGLATKGSDNLWIPFLSIICMRLPKWLPVKIDFTWKLALLLGVITLLFCVKNSRASRRFELKSDS